MAGCPFNSKIFLWKTECYDRSNFIDGTSCRIVPNEECCGKNIREIGDTSAKSKTNPKYLIYG